MDSPKTLRFVHAADLHLDSPFRGLSSLSPDMAGLLRDALFQAFDSLIDLCLDSRASFLLLAGDVFDWETPSLKAQLAFRDGLARLGEAGVKTFLVCGNHDPFLRMRFPFKWPQGVHMFGPDKVETVWLEGAHGQPVAISGISHGRPKERRNLVSLFPRLEEDCFHIGLVHANLGSDTGHEPYAPCTMEDLRSRGVDYWALGHVHTKRIHSEGPWVVYPGNIQGLSIREPGPRGCYLVRVDTTGGLEMEFRALDMVRWGQGEVEISEMLDIDALEEAVSEEMERLSDEEGSQALICRIRLTGHGDLYSALKEPGAVQALLERQRENFSSNTPLIWLQDIVLDCLPGIDLELRRQTQDLLGQVLRIAHEYDISEKALMDEFAPVLSPLFANQRAKLALEDLGKEDLREMLTQAQGILAVFFERQDQ